MNLNGNFRVETDELSTIWLKLANNWRETTETDQNLIEMAKIGLRFDQINWFFVKFGSFAVETIIIGRISGNLAATTTKIDQNLIEMIQIWIKMINFGHNLNQIKSKSIQNWPKSDSNDQNFDKNYQFWPQIDQIK